MGADIRTARPCFRFKRGTLTLFVETRAPETMAAVRTRLASALQARGGEDVFAGIGPDSIQLHARQPGGGDQLQLLDSSTKVEASGLEDDAVVYFALQRDDGSWEAPHAVGYDVDGSDMDVAV
ncbi:hypothetical protein IWQ57_003902 [Coemansia nantahalensis]|uniref:Uncharacterized protein n=1 Tax=Coemansia nantahalensis TaxID=2789366 RepID=A0ACC1JUG5_9FUNG|nr:hypothetical protein IWQ57_003902 [Coemansia nantahalensis]